MRGGDSKVFMLAGVPADPAAAACGPVARDARYQATWLEGERWFGGPVSLAAQSVEARDVAATLHGCAAFDAAISRGLFRRDDAIAEHSLGLYAGLYAAGAIPLDGALGIAREAARAILAESERAPGGLLAVTGLPEPAVRAIAADSGCEVANVNSPRQAVIGGDDAGLEIAAELARERGALDVRTLPVRAAIHTSRCAGAAERLKGFVKREVRIRAPRRRIIAHAKAGWLESAVEIRAGLEENLRSPVRWHDAVLVLRELGYGQFVDLGPGDALSRTVRFIDRDAECLALDGRRDTEAARRFLEGTSWIFRSPGAPLS